jgi:hypothetical protein
MTTQATPQAAGATLHLGGDAYAHPSLKRRLVPIENVTPYPGNPRRGDQAAITASIRDLGLYAGVVAQQSSGHILVGNHRRHALVELGAKKIPVDYLDVDDTRAAAIVARDNHTSDLGTYDEPELLALLTADVLPLSGYDDEDVAALLRSIDGPPAPDAIGGYTRKADPIQYTPTWEEPPEPGQLVDRSKTEALMRDILAADLPEDVADFLLAGAQRHLTFNYALVAEFYAHASPEVQDLMEASALVLIDFNDAIRHGYVRLSSRLAELLDVDLEYRAGLDRRSDSLRDPVPSEAADA